MKHTFIIAEAGVNHNGSIDLAKQLIDAASQAGADAVKFQTFNAVNMISKSAPKADYQTNTKNAGESQLEMLKNLEISKSDHEVLIKYCGDKNIQFLSSPFDSGSLEMLVDGLNLPLIKIASGEITNAPFLLEIAKLNKKIILSTGMCNLGDIEKALAVLSFGFCSKNIKPSIKAFYDVYNSQEGQKILSENVVLLHCTTEYPAFYRDVNLSALTTLKNTFGLAVGYSDHTLGIEIPIAAVAIGAEIIEKHFTLDKTLDGPDHKASLEPNELKAMVRSIRHIDEAIGHGRKIPCIAETKNIEIARKSIVAKTSIKKGDIFNENNITQKRPGSGLSPFEYWGIIGKTSQRDYTTDELLD